MTTQQLARTWNQKLFGEKNVKIVFLDRQRHAVIVAQKDVFQFGQVTEYFIRHSADVSLQYNPRQVSVIFENFIRNRFKEPFSYHKFLQVH
jgi:hypothetical protein